LTHWLTRLRGCVREVDLVGQLADARFIVILPQTRRRAAESLAHKVRTALGPASPFNLTAIEITAVPQLTQIVAGRNALSKSA
jgi:GGDEF domain-containing protein